MAHHYPPHAQAQPQGQPTAHGYPVYAASHSAAFYVGYPGVAGYPFDPNAVGAPKHVPTAPEIPGVSPQLASHAIQRLISSEMRDAGFETAEAGAVRRLELEVVSCELCCSSVPHPFPHGGLVVQQLYERAHDWAARGPREGHVDPRRQGGDMRLSVFHYPLTGWTDAVVMNVLMGSATLHAVGELAACSYQPLAEVLRVAV